MEGGCEDIEQFYATWCKCMDEVFTVSIVDILNKNCSGGSLQLSKEEREQIAYSYENQLGKLKCKFKEELKKLAGKHRLNELFTDSHEITEFTLLIAELCKQDTGFTEKEL
eukprot:TRINITY_DN11314_c0_g1_i2.p1 TRINITY_DN11314_c0_g1~~TRINITY_DN11314_c0_g1_i2.p1  ORF type:complete len:111 (-),score=51.87 TRINITY_DN11314_c0_g1_i2:331-663(-)